MLLGQFLTLSYIASRGSNSAQQSSLSSLVHSGTVLMSEGHYVHSSFKQMGTDYFDRLATNLGRAFRTLSTKDFLNVAC